MQHSEFTDRFSWMTGVQEYYSGTKYEKVYDPLFKALYHNNPYRLRDVLIDLANKSHANKHLKDNPEIVKSYYNTLLNNSLDDYEVKTRILIGLVSHFVEDDYTKRLYALHNLFLEQNTINPPQLKDFFSRGQVMSKKWLIQELTKLVDGKNLGHVAMYGAWYNFLAHMLYENFNINKIFSLDVDATCEEPIKRMYPYHYDKNIMEHITCDVGECFWQDDGLWYVDQEKRQADYNRHYNEKYEDIQAGYYDPKQAGVWNTFGNRKIGNVNLVINTSCEHMDNRWFNNLPDGTLVVLQTNDYFDNPQHVNCVRDLEQAKYRYPMSELLYDGYLVTELYTRFMLIGIK